MLSVFILHLIWAWTLQITTPISCEILALSVTIVSPDAVIRHATSSPNTNPAYEFRGLSTKNPCMNTSLNFILSIGQHSLNLVMKWTNKQLKWPMRSRLGLGVLIFIHCRPNFPPVLVTLVVALIKLHRITSSECGQITHHNEGRISQAATIYHCCICMCVSVNHFFN